MTKVLLRAFLSIMVFSILLAPCAFAQESPYAEAMKAYMQEKYVSAVEILKRQVAERPDPAAYYIMGYAVYALERKGDMQFGESAQYFQQAYFIDPEFDPSSIGFEMP